MRVLRTELRYNNNILMGAPFCGSPTTEPFPVPQAWAHTQPVRAPSLASGCLSFTSRACCG